MAASEFAHDLEGDVHPPPPALPQALQWKNYGDIFKVVPFARYFLNTFEIVAIDVVGALLSNTFIAYAFAPLTVLAFFGNAFYIFLLNQFFKTIPLEYDEAAFVDGANYFQIVVKIIVLMSQPALAVVALFTALASWNDFIGPFLYLNDQSIYTLSLGLKYIISGYSVIGQWQVLMAASVLVVLPVALRFFSMQRYFIGGLTMGGLKG